MEKEQIKKLQNNLWTLTTLPALEGSYSTVIDAIQALNKLQVEVERLKARIWHEVASGKALGFPPMVTKATLPKVILRAS